MNEIIIHCLNLVSPIYYEAAADIDPFDYKAENGESIFSFELNEAACFSFEAGKDSLLGSLLFCGRAKDKYSTGDNSKHSGKAFFELPCGHYLFAQKRELLRKDDIIALALEIQAEGLWQRLKLGKRLWLRYLFEDGSLVTQLFRPYTKNA